MATRTRQLLEGPTCMATAEYLPTVLAEKNNKFGRVRHSVCPFASTETWELPDLLHVLYMGLWATIFFLNQGLF